MSKQYRSPVQVFNTIGIWTQLKLFKNKINFKSKVSASDKTIQLNRLDTLRARRNGQHFKSEIQKDINPETAWKPKSQRDTIKLLSIKQILVPIQIHLADQWMPFIFSTRKIRSMNSTQCDATSSRLSFIAFHATRLHTCATLKVINKPSYKY